MPGNTVSLPALCSWANAAAAGPQLRRGSSANGIPWSGEIARVGRSLRYVGSSVGASTDSASTPPARKTETRIGLDGLCAVAACAIPSDSARPPSPRRPAPYTDTRPPAAASRKRRRSTPAPAGMGMRGSHSRVLAGPPEATAARIAWARVKPEQQLSAGGRAISRSANRGWRG